MRIYLHDSAALPPENDSQSSLNMQMIGPERQSSRFEKKRKIICLHKKFLLFSCTRHCIRTWFFVVIVLHLAFCLYLQQHKHTHQRLDFFLFSLCSVTVLLCPDCPVLSFTVQHTTHNTSMTPTGYLLVFSCTLYFILTWFILLIFLRFAFCLYLQQTTLTSMPPAGFELATLASSRPHTLALDHSVTGIGRIWALDRSLVAIPTNGLWLRETWPVAFTSSYPALRTTT